MNFTVKPAFIDAAVNWMCSGVPAPVGCASNSDGRALQSGRTARGGGGSEADAPSAAEAGGPVRSAAPPCCSAAIARAGWPALICSWVMGRRRGEAARGVGFADAEAAAAFRWGRTEGVTEGGATEGGATEGGGTEDGRTEGGATEGGGSEGGGTEGGGSEGGAAEGGAAEGGGSEAGETEGGATEGGGTEGGGTEGEAERCGTEQNLSSSSISIGTASPRVSQRTVSACGKFVSPDVWHPCGRTARPSARDASSSSSSLQRRPGWCRFAGTSCQFTSRGAVGSCARGTASCADTVTDRALISAERGCVDDRWAVLD